MLKDHLDQEKVLALKELKVQQELKVILEELRVIKEIQDLLVHKEQQVHKEKLDQLELKVLKVTKVQ